MRAWTLVGLLTISAALVVVGVAMLSVAAAYIASGGLLAGLSLLLLVEGRS